MALTGIEIFKHLPKTNCGKCGVPTCLAFAMSLAAGKAELSACPSVSDEAKAKLEEASAPPIRPITIVTGAKPLKIGGETVLFRHEKRLENPPGIAILRQRYDGRSGNRPPPEELYPLPLRAGRLELTPRTGGDQVRRRQSGDLCGPGREGQGGDGRRHHPHL